LFKATTAASQRPKTILFVGQMIERKGVDVLLRGFQDSRLASQGWRLRCIGDGPLSKQAAATPGCDHLPFCDADDVARHLANARLFVLPSRNDNWGVALHEAALSGCMLSASSTVGATSELMPKDSPLKFTPGSATAMRDALLYASSLPDEAIDAISEATHARAGDFGPTRFVREVAGFVADLTGVRLTGGVGLDAGQACDRAANAAISKA